MVWKIIEGQWKNDNDEIGGNSEEVPILKLTSTVSALNLQVKSRQLKSKRPPAPTNKLRSPPPRPERPHEVVEPIQKIQLSGPPPPPRIHKTYYQAAWEFEARNLDEISLQVGDVVLEIKETRRKMEHGWFYGENMRTRRIGLCPMNYLKPAVVSIVNSIGLSSSPVNSIDYSNESIKADQLVRSIKDPSMELPPPPPPLTVQYRSSQGVPVKGASFTHSTTNVSKVKNAGYATDVVAVRSLELKSIFATDFNVRFSGRSAYSAWIGDLVDILIDGKICLTMVLGENATAVFRNKKLQADSLVLGSIESLLNTVGCHILRYEHRYTYNEESRLDFIEAYLWLWDVSDSLIVSDIDGTVTRSDAGGLINGVLGAKLGWKKGHAHEGVCTLYNALLDKLCCRILYLTARPMNLINETRSYIYELEQPLYSSSMTNSRLPSGPIITDVTSISGSLRREVVDKSSHEFKIAVLLQLRDCFKHAGRDIRRYPVFLAAFGNKDTDVMAYKTAGVPPITVMVIDTKSNLQVADEYRQRMNSYHDARVLPLLLERIDLIKSGRLPDPNLSID